jgi:hypothetical protein
MDYEAIECSKGGTAQSGADGAICEGGGACAARRRGG